MNYSEPIAQSESSELPDRWWVKLSGHRIIFVPGGCYSVPNDCHPWDADCIVEQLIAEGLKFIR